MQTSGIYIGYLKPAHLETETDKKKKSSTQTLSTRRMADVAHRKITIIPATMTYKQG